MKCNMCIMTSTDVLDTDKLHFITVYKYTTRTDIQIQFHNLLDPSPVAVYILERMPATRDLILEKAMAAKKKAETAAGLETAAASSKGEVIGARAGQKRFVSPEPKWASQKKMKVEEPEEEEMSFAETIEGVLAGPPEEPDVVAISVSEWRFDKCLDVGDDTEAFVLGAIPGYYWEVGHKVDGSKIYKQEPPSDPEAANNQELILHREQSGWYISTKLFSEVHTVENVAVAWCGLELLAEGAIVHVPFWASKKTVQKGVVVSTMKSFVDSQMVALEDQLHDESIRRQAAEEELEDLKGLQEQRRQLNNEKGGGGGNINKMAALMCAVWDNKLQHARDLCQKYYTGSPIVKKAVDAKWK